jgi:hypothetical protein
MTLVKKIAFIAVVALGAVFVAKKFGPKIGFNL